MDFRMIVLKTGDITEEDTDAIVNAANSKLAGGGGVDGAIHRAAGPTVMEEGRAIGGCATGSAVVTGAGKLKAKKIIHAVGPVWQGGGRNEAALLKSAYDKCFELAIEQGLKSISFPAISTGVYGYPKEPAAWIALGTGRAHESKFQEIRYICFSEKDLEVYQHVWAAMNRQTDKAKSPGAGQVKKRSQ